MKTSVVCRWPSFTCSKGDETNLSLGMRTTVLALALLLGITGILALRKIAPFNRLGPKYGWPAVAFSASIIILTGLLKQVKKDEVDASAQVKPAGKKAEKKDPKSPQLRFESHPAMNIIDKPIFGRGMYFVNDHEVAAHTKENVTFWSALTGLNMTKIRGSAAYQSQSDCKIELVAKENDRVAFFDSRVKSSIYVTSIDPNSPSGTTEADPYHQDVKIPLEQEPERIALNGNFLAIGFKGSLEIYALIKGLYFSQRCAKQGKLLHKSVFKGEITNFFFDSDTLIYTYKSGNKEVIERIQLKDPVIIQFKELAAKQGKSVFIIDKERYVYKNDQEFLLCSFNNGAQIKSLGYDRDFEKFVIHKDLLVGYANKLDEDGVRRTYVTVFSVKTGEVLQEFSSEDDFCAIDMRMVRNEVVIAGHTNPSYSRKPKIWKLSLSAPR